jgi:uncharacterized protein YcbK (DUF882 family)
VVFLIAILTIARLAARRRIGQLAAGAAFVAALTASTSTQTVLANGETRTLSLYHSHTKESVSVTFRRGGSYDADGLEKLNWALRDWRTNAPTKMDPRLFDIVWEVYQESGSTQPIVVVSAYRAPETNAMLRRRSSGVAKNSQHILGKAMDMHYVDVSMSKIRELGMRLQRGGVGYYPTSGTPFVHLDAGNVRAWPRMTYEQLARLFPDGKTVHLPSNGQPLPGYELARAEIEARGGGYVASLSQARSKGLFASLFGGGDDDEDQTTSRQGARGRVGGRLGPATMQVASLHGDDTGSRSFFAQQSADPIGRAEQNLPRGETVMRASEPVMRASEPIASGKTPADEAKPTTTLAALKPIPSDEAASLRHAVPLPPRRPGPDTTAVAYAPDLPVPPSRPATATSLASLAPMANPIAAVLHDSDATGSIGTAASSGSNGSKTPAGNAAAALAYAAPPPARALRPAARQALADRGDLVAARLDVANYHALTGPQSTTAERTASAIPPQVASLRAAARVDVVALAVRPASGMTIRFGSGLLSSETFAQR